MVQVAAEVADGLLGHAAFTPSWVQGVVRPAIVSGAVLRQPGLAPLRFLPTVSLAVHPDRETARVQARLHVAVLAAGRAYEELFAQAGFQAELAVIRAGGETLDAAARAVTDVMIDAFTVAGSPGEVRDRLGDRLREADELIVSPLSAPSQDEANFARQVLLLGESAMR